MAKRVHITRRRAHVDPEKAKRIRVRRKAANRMLFKEDRVRKLPVKKKQYMVWDAGTDAVRGLGILVSPQGARSYRAVYYFPGSEKAHSKHLGRVGEMLLDDARRLTREARDNARNGIDPKADDPTRSDTYKAAVEDYIKREQMGRKENPTANECQRVLLSCTDWHLRPLATIRPQEIQTKLETIRDVPGGKRNKKRPYLANTLHTRLRTFFAWCVKPNIGKLKSSPMTGIERPFTNEKSRDRVYSDDEIKELWAAADRFARDDVAKSGKSVGEFGKSVAKFMKLLLLTGKRKTALAAMDWKQLDDTWFWTPPPSKQKSNKRLHPIPLPGLAKRVLGSRQKDGHIFPGRIEGEPIDLHSQLQRRIQSESGIKDWFPHAHRHTIETRLAEFRVEPHIRDLLLDHVSKRGSGKGYDHHHYKDEMREAMEMWAAHVERIITPQGVARLR